MLRRCVRFMSSRDWIDCFHHKKFHTNASKVLYSSFDKDLPNPNQPTPLSKAINHESDILLDQLRNARTLERIFELSSMHLDVMNSKHIVTSIENINIIAKQYGQGDDLMNNPIFQGICSRLMKTIRFLDAQELITLYKSLSTLGVQNNTYVMQAILKMMGGHLNNMSLGQLTFLSFLLSKQRHNSLVDGLRLALPLVLQVQIEQQIDSDNITSVVNCLQIACRSRLKPATIQKVLTVVLQKAKSLGPQNAITVAYALLSLETPMDGYKELINYSFDILAKNVELLDCKQINNLLRFCAIRNFYHSGFYFAVADKITYEKWNLEMSWDAISNLHRMTFSPPNLMDHFVDVIRLESDVFRTTSMYSPLRCVEYLSATGYHPPNIEEVLQTLCSCETKITAMFEKSPYLYVKFFSCLAMLGYFPRAHLSKVLDEEFLFNTWSNSRKISRGIEFERWLFSFARSLEVYDRHQDFSIPPAVMKNLIQNVCERYSESTCPLQKFIENGLGGSQFLKSGIFTSDGLFIDHVVAMRSGNYPVSLDSLISNQSLQRNVFAEDINLPADAKLVAIIVAKEDKYCKDPEVLKGFMDLNIRYLAKKKFSPVVINYCNWNDLPDREKIPYLMQAIKNAIQGDQISSTNSPI